MRLSKILDPAREWQSVKNAKTKREFFIIPEDELRLLLETVRMSHTGLVNLVSDGVISDGLARAIAGMKAREWRDVTRRILVEEKK